MLRFGFLFSTEPLEKPLGDSISLLEKAVRLDSTFTLAYCELARANGLLYVLDPAPERRPAGEAAIKSALRLQPDLPEVHLAYAYHLSFGYDEQDYEQGGKNSRSPRPVCPITGQLRKRKFTYA
jgi:hypothetical protein